MSCFYKFISHLKLCYHLRNYYYHYKDTETYTETYSGPLLDNILNSVTECGAVMIKFCQWLTPKLELIYLENNDILLNKTPPWLLKLEQYYENCGDHSREYTMAEYEKVFGHTMEEVYHLKQVIGSGSIGQVYLIENKETGSEEVLKILHPDVRNQMSFFETFIKFLLMFPCINNKKQELFPFDIFDFIDQFKMQTDFINEANHIIHFMKEYKNNEFVIIPEIIKITPSILIMSYEPGISFSELSLSDYHKEKIVNLYHLFIRNNQVITNYNHGDLHPGNWKVRLDPKDLNHKLVIHDFGYCWRIPVNLFAKIGTIFVDTFEESSNNVETSIDNLCELTYWSVLYNKPDKETEYKVKIREHVVNEIRIRNITELSVIDSLKATIIFCNKENLLLDPTLIQCYIIFIQGQKLFEQYDLMKGDKDDTTPYEVFRERYLNIYTFCKTYNIFPKYSKNIENKLNKKQIAVTNIFDTIDFDDTNLEKMALTK